MNVNIVPLVKKIRDIQAVPTPEIPNRMYSDLNRSLEFRRADLPAATLFTALRDEDCCLVLPIMGYSARLGTIAQFRWRRGPGFYVNYRHGQVILVRNIGRLILNPTFFPNMADEERETCLRLMEEYEATFTCQE